MFGSDGDFTWDRFEEKYNVDLANNLGNLVNRVTAMAERYRRVDLPPRRLRSDSRTLVTALANQYAKAMDELALDVACQSAFRVVDATNEYIAAQSRGRWPRRAASDALDEVLWTAAKAPGLRRCS